ncbi:unnamed protein product, partial [Ectocarpus sp. 8 AP-2014]
PRFVLQHSTQRGGAFPSWAMTRLLPDEYSRYKCLSVGVALGVSAVFIALQGASGLQPCLNLSSRKHRTPRASRTAMPAAADANGALPNDDNAFRLVQYRDAVELQTAAYKLRPRTSEDAVDIVLVSMVHLADQAYYTEIMRDASSYDRVLFELIAGPGVSELDADGNRAVTEYVYPTRE